MLNHGFKDNFMSSLIIYVADIILIICPLTCIKYIRLLVLIYIHTYIYIYIYIHIYIYIYISLPIKIKQYVIMTGELFCIAIYAIMRAEKYLASSYILM